MNFTYDLRETSCKSTPDRKIVSKGGDETGAETLDIRVPKVIG